MTKLRFRQVHLDFHTSEQIAGIGSQFDPDLVEVFIGSFERLSPASQAQREL